MALTQAAAMPRSRLRSRSHHPSPFAGPVISLDPFHTVLSERVTLAEYRKLKRPKRFEQFQQNEVFMLICSEADNHIGNASHHSSFAFDRTNQTLTYHLGEGGTGKEHRIAYTDYLEHCVRLFLQAMTLLRIELLISTSRGIHRPI
jgi:hypothetical protein